MTSLIIISMRRIYYCLFLLIGTLIESCVSNTEEVSGIIQVVDVSNPKHVKLDDLFSELEVIHMESGIKSYVPNARYVQQCGDKYIFMDNSLNFYVFDTKGHFISSSKLVEGHGHGEYTVPMGGCYNPYTKNIEIITPLNLLVYDMNFKFIKSVPLPAELPNESNNNHAQLFEYIYDLSDHLHVLISSSDPRTQYVNTMFIFDSEKQEVIKKISFNEDVIHNIFSQSFPFLNYDDENLLFIPPRNSQCIYKFDKKKQELQRFLSFNYGKDFYSPEDLETIRKSSGEKEMYKYIVKNPKKFPLMIFYDEGYFYIMVNGATPRVADSSVIIVDSKTGESSVLPFAKDNKIQFYPLSFVSKKMLYVASDSYVITDSLINAFPGKVTEVNKYNADSTVNDNIAVLKYHLK